MPVTTKVKNEMIARVPVTLRLLVAVKPPGTRPSRLQVKMKKKSVRRKGVNRLPHFSPMFPMATSSLTNTTSVSKAFAMPRGASRPAREPRRNTPIKAIRNADAISIMTTALVMPSASNAGCSECSQAGRWTSLFAM